VVKADGHLSLRIPTGDYILFQVSGAQPKFCRAKTRPEDAIGAPGTEVGALFPGKTNCILAAHRSFCGFSQYPKCPVYPGDQVNAPLKFVVLQIKEESVKRSVLNLAGFAFVFLCVSFAAYPVSAENTEVIYSTDFEAGLGDWSTDNGVWEAGSPPAGLGNCYEGSRCAGTRAGLTAGRLISPPLVLPSVAEDEEIHLSFRHWFSYGPDFQGSGTIEVSCFDFQKAGWSQWEPFQDSFVGESKAWLPGDVDLTAFFGKTVRIAFKNDPGKNGDGSWYVDTVQIRKIGNDSAEEATGTTPTVTSFKINNGAATTTKRTVTLNNSTTGKPTSYQASESSKFTGATWKTYSTKPSFTLSAGVGTKTVYFKVKNAAGQSPARHASIKLTDPLGGTWNGSWTSDYGGGSGGVTLVVTQTASGYSGTLTVRNTGCGTYSNVAATITLSGSTVKVTASSKCSGEPVVLSFTQGTLSGNTIDGDFNVYVYGSWHDGGTFELSK